MEEVVSHGSFFIITIFFLIPIFFTLLKPILTKTTPSSPRLPPGPRWKLPIIGHLHHMLIGKSSYLPHHCLAELANQYGPLMHLTLGETSNVVVSSPELAEQFLKTHDLQFATRPKVPSANIILYDCRDIAFGAYGEYWRQMRKICTLELFSARRVKLLRPVREDKIGELVRSISSLSSSGQPINLSRLMISAGNVIAFKAAFGKTKKLEEAFLPLMHKVAKVLGGLSLDDMFPSIRFFRVVSGKERELKKLHIEVDAILEGIIDEHIQRRSQKDADVEEEEEDLVDVLLNFTENQNLGFPFTNVEVKAVILDVFLGGSDTASSTVEWAMSELMKNRSVMEKAQKEVRQVFGKRGRVDEASLHKLQYLPLIIKETLRLHPVAPLLFPRECRETTVVDGYLIPVKTRVIVNAWAIGRDPKHWSDPDEFKPERFVDSCVDYKGHDFQLIPFGAGRRACPGMQYGIALVEILFANLLYHFDWKLPEKMRPEDIDMEEDFGAVVTRKNSLFLVPVPYRSV
ncbi:Desmethyl-deoxy-podophyllotoxin synthase [Linum grandiflorum]